MYVATAVGLVVLSTAAISGGAFTARHFNLPESNETRIAEAETRQEAMGRALNKIILDKIIESCSNRYSDIHNCPEYIEVVKPDGFNLLGKEVTPPPKVGSNG